ncbi:MAG: FixH family protein [Rhizobiaceae bacterium]|nr:FixH family protein [Rhizobiaceae bacterium]
MSVARESRGFTGWHMLFAMVAFFGTVITVNLIMAYLANSSWSGMLSKNTYVASQEFNKNAARAREWAREGFKGVVTIGDGMVRYRLDGPADVVAAIDHVEALFHRPVGDKQDFSVKLLRDGDMFVARTSPAKGPWVVDFAAFDDGRIVFHQAERVVSGGP